LFCLIDATDSHRKRRAVYESDATVKASRQTRTADEDNVKADVSSAAVDARSSPLPKNSNIDGVGDRKQSPLTCPRCDFTADERSVLSRHVRSHSRHQSPTSSPDVIDDDDDDVDVETEDVVSATTAEEDLRDLFCVDCCIQFTSPATFRAHRSFYCKRRGKHDAAATDDQDAAVRRRRRASGSGSSFADQSRSRPDGLRPPIDMRAALFPSSLAALSSPAGLMEMLSSGVAPPPPPPGAFFLAPFLAAAAAAAGVSIGGLAGGTAAVQQSSPNLSTSSRPLQSTSVDRRSSTSVSDDEPLDLSTCRNVATDVIVGKHDSVSPTAAAASPASAVGFSRHFAAAPGIDVLDASSLFLPPTVRLPLNALPAVRPPLSSPPSISHCAECNIVFYKHANYLAHKAHYCAGRHATPSSGSSGAQDQTGAVSGPAGKTAAMLKSDDVGRGSTLLDDGRRRSPDPHELVATLDDTGTTIQFYCIPCKIKFSSLDTLRAHKQFYCPARFDAPPTGSCGELTTSARHRHASRVYGGADDGERQAADVVPAGGSCTACGTRVTSPRSGHRCTAAAVTPSLYQCPHCDYTAQSDSRLVEHVRAHAPSRAFRCALCGYRGNTVRGMRMHGKMHNDEAAAAAGRAGNTAQLPTFTDDCVIEYEEPPAIPPRRHAGTAAGSGATARPGVDTDLLRQKNEPYKRRRSRKAYEKAEYAPAVATTPVCAECSAPLLDTTHAQAHASAHAAERLLAWEALYGAGTIAKSPAVVAVPVCKAEIDVDQQQTISPVADETTAKTVAQPIVKVEQSDNIEQQTTTDRVDNDDGRKCNGTDRTEPVDDDKSTDVRDDATSSASPADDVDVTGSPSTRPDADDEVRVPATTPVGRRSSPPGRPLAVPCAAAATAVGARRSSSLDATSRYCEQCDITFMYASTFVAHKKYYCSSHAAERTDATTRASAATGVAV